MKYFRFVCDIKTKPSEAVDTTRDSPINEVGVFCAYLSRMYEYYFPATQTDNVVSITVCLTEDAQEAEHPQSCANIKVVTNVMDIGKFTRLTPSGKSLYIIGLCQQAIMSLVSEMSWETESFEHTYNRILGKNCLFREYWRKAKCSPNRQLKAQIYFEDDYEKDGIYVDFTDKSGKLIKRVQFAPSGYHIYSKSISELEWENNSHVIIKRAFSHSCTKTCDYWIIGIDGSIDYHSPRAENSKVNPHGLFDLGILYWEGKIIMPNQDKGLELIRKAAELNYKHAQKWIERNISITANKQQTD